MKTKKYLMIIAGFVFGVLAACMTVLGNPGNMGVCIACFYRDISGALGLHRAEIVQYLRPEIMGICLGALIAAVAFKEFKPRGGSNPLVRFLLGMFLMIGALVFWVVRCVRSSGWPGAISMRFLDWPVLSSVPSSEYGF